MNSDFDLDLDLNLQRARAVTRRQFLKHSQTGLGAIALAMLGGREGAARIDRPSTARTSRPPPTTRWRPGRRISRPRPSASSICTCRADRRSRTSSTTSPTLVKHNMQPCPDELLKNQRFAFIKGHPKLLGSPYKFGQRGQSGAGSASSCPHIGEVVDDIAVIRSMHTDQFNHAPAELFLYTGTSAQRRGGDGLVDHLRAGLGEPGPARLRRPDQRRHRPDRRQGPLEHRLPAQRLPGRAVPDGGRPDPLRQRPQGDGPGRPPPHARRPAPAQRVRARGVRRPRDPDADQPVRAGLPHADVGPRRDGHPPGARERSWRCTAPSRARRRSPTTACWPAGWSSGACATSSSSTGAGTATAPARATTSSSTCPRSARRSTGRSRPCSRT